MLGGPGPSPPWAGDALAVLVNAAERWEHLASGQLGRLLAADPGLVRRAEGTVLTTLAGIPEIPRESLDAAYDGLSTESRLETDVGAAALAARLIPARLAETESASAHAWGNTELAVRLFRAGRYAEAAEPAMRALTTGWLPIVRDDTERAHAVDFAGTLTSIGEILAQAGRTADALAAARRAVEILRDEEARQGRELPGLATALSNLALRLRATGRYEDAHAAVAEAAARCDRAADGAPDARLPDRAMVYGNLGICLRELRRYEEAVAAARTSYEIIRGRARDGGGDGGGPGGLPAGYAEAASNLATLLGEAGRIGEALPLAAEGVAVHRRLVRANPAAHSRGLGIALSEHSGLLLAAGDGRAAEAAAREAAELLDAVDAVGPDTRHVRAAAHYRLGTVLLSLRRPDAAAGHAKTAVALWRRLAADHPGVYEHHLAKALTDWVHARVEAREGLAFAAEAAAEAVRLYERLGRDAPSVYGGELRRARAVHVTALAAVGRTDEAMRVLGPVLASPDDPADKADEAH